MSISADFAQTFYIDKETVKNAGYAFINGVDLFFKDKPAAIGSTTSTQVSAGSFLPNPGVTVYICETDTINGIPVPKLSGYVKYGYKRLEHSNILTSSTGLVATTFTFPVPVPIATDKSYALVIGFDGNDQQYSLWRNKAGETYNGIQNPTVTKGSMDGSFFVITNGTQPMPMFDTDLKFIMRGQKFQKNTPYVFNAVNRDYEFLSIRKANTVGKLIGGEAVFANTGYITSQTVSVSTSSRTVTGTNTLFTTTHNVGDFLVINSGNNNGVFKIASIANNTSLQLEYPASFTNTSASYLIAPVATVIDFNYLNNFCILGSSTANSTMNFIANSTVNTLIGTRSGASVNYAEVLDVPINYYTPEFKLLAPVGTTANIAVKFANTTYASDADDVEVRLYDKNLFTKFKAIQASRSNEVTNPSNLLNTKSTNFDITFQTTNEFITPVLDEEDLIFHAGSAYLNYTLVNENTSRGAAQSKVISKKIVLANTQMAEDVKAYVTAHRPVGTDVELFVKFYNNDDPQTFDQASWTRLKKTTTDDLISAIDNESDMIELEYELAPYPLSMTSTTSSGTRLDCYITSDRNSNQLVSTIDMTGLVAEGDIIRLFNPLFPDHSLVTAVNGVLGNRIRIAQVLDEDDSQLASFIGTGLVIEVVECNTSAFKDVANLGILKYYNAERSAFSGYNAFAVKIVLLSDEENPVFPIVDDVRVIAVSV